jgi:hypothetical protein
MRPSLARSGYGAWWRVGIRCVPRWRVRATVRGGGLVPDASLAGAFGLRWVVEGWYPMRPSLARSGYGGWWRVGTRCVPRWRVRATVGGGGLVPDASLAGAFGLRWVVDGWYPMRPSLARSGYGGWWRVGTRCVPRWRVRATVGGGRLVSDASLAGAFGLRWVVEGWYPMRPSLARSGYGGWWTVGIRCVPRWRVRATVGGGGLVPDASLAGAFGLRWVVDGWYPMRPSLARSGYGGWWRVGTRRVPRWRVRAMVGGGGLVPDVSLAGAFGLRWVVDGWYPMRPSLARSGYGGWWRVGTRCVPRWRVRAMVGGGGLVPDASLAGAFGLRWVAGQSRSRRTVNLQSPAERSTMASP